MLEVTVPAAFEWGLEPAGRVLRCLPLGRIAPHLFSTRDLVLEPLDEPRGAGWAALADAMGVTRDAVMRLCQVHGTRVITLRDHANWQATVDAAPAGDILVTDCPSVALSVRVADCNPILIADPRSGVVGAAHAGWRGTAAGAAATTVRAMIDTFGCEPAELVAAIGPSIGPCCYHVGFEVRRAFAQAGANDEDLARWFLRDPARVAPSPGFPPPASDRGADAHDWAPGASDVRFPTAEPLTDSTRRTAGDRSGVWADLWTANRDQLVAAGLLPDHVHVARLCTACHTEVFRSYRAERTGGRMVGIIRARFLTSA